MIIHLTCKCGGQLIAGGRHTDMLAAKNNFIRQHKGGICDVTEEKPEQVPGGPDALVAAIRERAGR